MHAHTRGQPRSPVWSLLCEKHETRARRGRKTAFYTSPLCPPRATCSLILSVLHLKSAVLASSSSIKKLSRRGRESQVFFVFPFPFCDALSRSSPCDLSGPHMAPSAMYRNHFRERACVCVCHFPKGDTPCGAVPICVYMYGVRGWLLFRCAGVDLQRHGRIAL